MRALNRALIIKAKPVNSKDAVHVNAEVTNIEEIPIYIDQRISTPDFQTFQCLLNNIINMIEKHYSPARVAVKPFLNEPIVRMPWSEVQQQQMMLLVDTGNINQVRSYRPDQLKTFLSQLHTWMADEVGVSDAIRIVK